MQWTSRSSGDHLVISLTELNFILLNNLILESTFSLNFKGDEAKIRKLILVYKLVSTQQINYHTQFFAFVPRRCSPNNGSWADWCWVLLIVGTKREIHFRDSHFIFYYFCFGRTLWLWGASYSKGGWGHFHRRHPSNATKQVILQIYFQEPSHVINI